METKPALEAVGELAGSCFLIQGRNDLRLSEEGLPAFLVQAFRSAGSGDLEQAAALLTPENIRRMDALRDENRPGALIAGVVLGLVLQQLGRFSESMTRLREAVQREPNAAVYNLLANVCHQQGCVSEALAARGNALKLAPHDEVIQGAYARDLMAVGQLEQGIERLRDLIDQGQISASDHSLYLLHRHYLPRSSQPDLLEEHRRWAAVHAPVERACARHLRDRDPDRRLRIGYVSADFHEHAASYAIRAILEHRDPQAFAVYGYSNVAAPDAVTRSLAACMDVFRPLGSMDDRSVADLVQDDRIDILVAMSGHTAGHRLGVLACKPAPIQVDWGWINTTGMEQIDYRFTDDWLNPAGTDDDVVETLIRLPGGMSRFTPPRRSPEINRLPAERRGYVTFGCANSHLKINGSVISLWAQVLRACPGSRMVIKCQAGQDPPTRQRWQAEFRQHGVESHRVTVMGWQDRHHYLTFYHDIDIALDTHPFNGCITSLEALWMGVPVVSLAGPLWVSRMGLSLLASAGLEAFAASSPEQFVAKAMALAARKTALSRIRATMRPRLLDSSLFEGRRLAQDIEAAYRKMWRGWCQLSPKTGKNDRVGFVH